MSLLSFKAKNFFSFKEGVELSMRLNKNCPARIDDKTPFATTMCIKGANASGKTNLLKGIFFVSNFIVESFGDKPEEKIKISTFGNDKNSSFFELDFLLDEIEYNYHLEVTKTEVISEILYKKKSRKSKVFERKLDVVIYAAKNVTELKKIKVRTNSSIISTAVQYESKIALKISNYFKHYHGNIHFYGMIDHNLSVYEASELFQKEEEIFNFTKDFIKRVDLGISEIELHEFNDAEGKKKVFPIFVHENGKEEIPVISVFESSGTKTLFTQLPLYFKTLSKGGVFLLDEFDKNLHPHILQLLIKLFNEKESNPKNAQLIFTTHDTKVIDTMTKYRLFIINKENNESHGYRADEISSEIIRNDREISPAYDKGIIGGVPRL